MAIDGDERERSDIRIPPRLAVPLSITTAALAALFFIAAFSGWSLWTFIPIVVLGVANLVGVEIARTLNRR